MVNHFELSKDEFDRRAAEDDNPFKGEVRYCDVASTYEEYIPDEVMDNSEVLRRCHNRAGSFTCIIISVRGRGGNGALVLGQWMGWRVVVCFFFYFRSFRTNFG